jgi:hypothetical protein
MVGGCWIVCRNIEPDPIEVLLFSEWQSFAPMSQR